MNPKRISISTNIIVKKFGKGDDVLFVIFDENLESQEILDYTNIVDQEFGKESDVLLLYLIKILLTFGFWILNVHFLCAYIRGDLIPIRSVMLVMFE